MGGQLQEDSTAARTATRTGGSLMINLSTTDVSDSPGAQLILDAIRKR
jgi:hypothetical protein